MNQLLLLNVVDQVKILSARRAYEFGVDGLRLTALSIAEIPDSIKRHFNFQTLQVTTPQPTFGPVSSTIPPGLVYTLGSTQTPDGSFVAIRYMNFEPQRIVIDVAGPSSVIDQIYEQLQELLAEVHAPDGSLAVGEPVQILDNSEVSAQLSFDIDSLISDPLSASAQRTLIEDENNTVIPATIVLQVVNPLNEVAQPSSGQVVLQIRAGSRVDEKVYFCIAEFTTDWTLAWLEDLDRELGMRQREFTDKE